MRNAVDTPMHWQKWNRLRDDLAERFPLAFVRDGQPRRPLKIGIHADLGAALAGEVPAAQIRRFLQTWCRRSRYVAAVAAGGERVGLDGATAGEVAPEHATYAAQTLARRAAQAAERDAPEAGA